jgi:hypothetical protein
MPSAMIGPHVEPHNERDQSWDTTNSQGIFGLIAYYVFVSATFSEVVT